MTGKTLQNGQVVSYREFGSGPNLFLIHGFGGSPRDWETVAQELSPRFHVIVPNLGPVFLDHENADSMSFKNHVQVLIDFILSFSKQGQPNYLAAASYGAMVSLAALIEAAQWGTSAKLVDRVALVGPMPTNPAPKLKNQIIRNFIRLAKHPLLLDLYLLSPLGKFQLPLIEHIFHAPWVRTHKHRRLALLTSRKLKVITQVIRCFSRIIRKEDWAYWESRFHAVNTPVVILQGSEDSLFHDDALLGLTRYLANCEFHKIEFAGHLAMCEMPNEVARHCIHFFGFDSQFLEAR